MKRRSTQHYTAWQEYKILEAVDSEKLKLIGAICLQWNFIEDLIDDSLSRALHLDHNIEHEVTSRIYGLDGKFEIIKKASKEYLVFTETESTMIAATIGAVAEHKTYRDAVTHAKVYDPQSDIALSSRRRGVSIEVLISIEALSALLERLTVISDEIVSVFRLLEAFYYDEWDLIPEGEIDPKKVRASPYFQVEISQLRKHQKRRLNLPPLPKFPDEPQGSPNSEARPTPPD